MASAVRTSPLFWGQLYPSVSTGREQGAGLAVAWCCLLLLQPGAGNCTEPGPASRALLGTEGLTRKPLVPLGVLSCPDVPGATQQRRAGSREH